MLTSHKVNNKLSTPPFAWWCDDVTTATNKPLPKWSRFSHYTAWIIFFHRILLRTYKYGLNLLTRSKKACSFYVEGATAVNWCLGIFQSFTANALNGVCTDKTLKQIIPSIFVRGMQRAQHWWTEKKKHVGIVQNSLDWYRAK